MARRVGPLRGLLLALVLSASCAEDSVGLAADEPAQEARLAQADEALAAGRHAEAADIYRALLEEASAAGTSEPSQLAPLRRGLGRALLAAGETYGALEPLEALARSGEAADLALYVEGLLAHARATLEGGGVTPARVMPYLEDARRALARIPEPQAAAHGRAWLLGETAYLGGKLEEAVNVWAGARESLSPVAPERWYRERHAHALYLLARHAEAAAVYESLGNARAAAAGWAAAQEGEKALAHYAALLASAPSDAALLEEAIATARYTGLEARLEEILAALDGGDPASRLALAGARSRLAQQRGDHAAARRVLEVAKPGLTGATLADLDAALATTWLLDPAGGETGRAAAAAACLEGFEAQPGHPRLAALMSLMAEQDYRAAPGAWPDRAPLERSLALQRALARALPDDPLMLANLGNIARLAGEAPASVQALEAAVALTPGDASIRNDLGLAYLAAGQAEHAVAAFLGATEDDPTFLAARQNLARSRRPYGPSNAAEARAHLLHAEQSARSAGQPALLYRALALRIWRQQATTVERPAGER